MTFFARWIAFNFVGAVGMLVQLAALALFDPLFHGHYLIASAAALEVTLLQNFVWHTRYTWRDRRDGFSIRRQFVRFHLSSGLLSLAGNLALMRLLVHVTHLPVLVANAMAVLCCSVVNFWLSHRWAFSAPRRSLSLTPPSPRTAIAGPLLALPLIGNLACFEARAQLPNAPSFYSQKTAPGSLSTQPTPTIHPYRSSILAHYAYYGAAFCGLDLGTSEVATVPAASCGVGFSFPITPMFLEVGVMGPQANRSYVSAYLSADAKVPVASSGAGYTPIVIIGYSRLFETGHALDYGIGLETPRLSRLKRDDSKGLLFELRDYWTFANPPQHNVMLRIGWIVGVPD